MGKKVKVDRLTTLLEDMEEHEREMARHQEEITKIRARIFKAMKANRKKKVVRRVNGKKLVITRIQPSKIEYDIPRLRALVMRRCHLDQARKIFQPKEILNRAELDKAVQEKRIYIDELDAISSKEDGTAHIRIDRTTIEE